VYGSRVLFEPWTFRSGAVAPNRIALAPMTNMQSQPDGTLGDDELTWLARRADGGFGLLETCAAYVGLDGKAWPGQLGIDRDALLPGLTRLATRLKTGGGLALVQLFHGGVRADPALTGEPTWSASTFTEESPGFIAPRAATPEDIGRVVEQFTAAAERAQAAGFDGIELHGAHGYLLCQFLSATMNTRDDEWGGDAPRRSRLIREITRAIRARTRPDFLLGVRLSLEDWGNARGLDLDDSLTLARDLVDDGADFIHASLWDVTRPTKKRPDAHPLALLDAALPGDVAAIACGKMYSRADADAAMTLGADFIALGRAAILNPDWPRTASDPTWEPLRPPVTRDQLLSLSLSPTFADYMRHWRNFVSP
jgi:2,4-dienoyl-CoA reductase-like NADH-dependent reductase (Old Yellow Enzyme family)